MQIMHDLNVDDQRHKSAIASKIEIPKGNCSLRQPSWGSGEARSYTHLILQRCPHAVPTQIFVAEGLQAFGGRLTCVAEPKAYACIFHYCIDNHSYKQPGC